MIPGGTTTREERLKILRRLHEVASARIDDLTAAMVEEFGDVIQFARLIEAYAHCADRRDAQGQMALFTPNTHFVVYMNAKDPKLSRELQSREALAPLFADLNPYDATTHFPRIEHHFHVDG